MGGKCTERTGNDGEPSPALTVRTAAKDRRGARSLGSVHNCEAEVEMPRFMDYHDDLRLPAEAIDQITNDTKEEKTDEFGVRQIELFHNADGKVYCLLEAPDADAVRRHHEALGVPCGDVHEVRTLL
jgi:hypothetical protein